MARLPFPAQKPHGSDFHPRPAISECAPLRTGLGALRAAATPRHGPDQEVDLKKISGGRMT